MNIDQLISDGLDAAKRFIKWLLPSSKHILDIALSIVNGMKSFDDSHPEVVNFVTSLIPGNTDDAIVAKIREYLPAVLVRLRWADTEAAKDDDELVADASKFINSLPVGERSVALQVIWQLISNRLTDDGVSISDLQKIGQVYYQSTK
jgi:hypothetical protein